MKLELTQKLQQQQILAPQMILSMDILLLTAADLQQRIEQEFIENPALELSESSQEGEAKTEATERSPENQSDPERSPENPIEDVWLAVMASRADA